MSRTFLRNFSYCRFNRILIPHWSASKRSDMMNGGFAETNRSLRKIINQALIGTEGIDGEHNKKIRLSSGLKSMAGPNPAFRGRTFDLKSLKKAGPKRLELSTSCVTGRRSNQTELRPRKLFYFKRSTFLSINPFILSLFFHFFNFFSRTVASDRLPNSSTYTISHGLQYLVDFERPSLCRLIRSSRSAVVPT